MTTEEMHKAFLADWHMGRRHRETILTLWTARICFERQIGQVGERSDAVRAELLALVETEAA